MVRRNIDSVVLQIRREIAEACSKMADERGEPPLEEQSLFLAVNSLQPRHRPEMCAVGARLSMPRTAVRIAPCPTSVAILLTGPASSSRRKYSSPLDQVHGIQRKAAA